MIGCFQGLADDDVVVSFNFRKDRPRQIVAALADPAFEGFDRGAYPRLDLCCMVDEDRWVLAPAGSLADVAPSVLHLMGIPAPAAMTGRSMLIRPLPAQSVAALERLDAA